MNKQYKGYGGGGKKMHGKKGGASHSTIAKAADMGKMPNWDGRKQGPSKVNKGFGPC